MQTKHLDSSMDRAMWKTRSISQPGYKQKVNKQLTNQRSAFSATCCTIRAGCYSDLGCATCCVTQKQPMTDVQQNPAAALRNKSLQQKSTCVIGVNEALTQSIMVRHLQIWLFVNFQNILHRKPVLVHWQFSYGTHVTQIHCLPDPLPSHYFSYTRCKWFP